MTSPSPCRLAPRRTLRHTVLALLLVLPLWGRATTAWVATSTEKIRPTAAPRAFAPAAISAARNEFEAFQIAVVGPATGVSATASALSGPAELAGPRLYREAIIRLANASGPDGSTGDFPDALIPDVDDVVGERRNAFPFDVPAGQTRVIWAEVLVPSDAAPGTYRGSVLVRANEGDATVPVSLTVHDFALPSTSSLRSHFGLSYGDIPAQHGVSGDAFSTLRARYSQLGLDHRISMGWFDDGNADLNHIAQFYGALIDGTAPTQLAGARLTSVQYLGPITTAGYAAWATLFRARGWFDRLFDYTCDEPPAFCAWSDITARQAVVKAADPALKTLVTTSIQDAQENGVLSAVDILTPVVNYLHGKSAQDPGGWDDEYSGIQIPRYADWLASSPQKELWTYQSCMSHGCDGTSPYFEGWVSYSIDHSAMRSRGMEWTSFQLGATGELYYAATEMYSRSDPWTDEWNYGGNGDGSLFYPGTPATIGGTSHIPLSSLRLKMIREGMEDYEYLKALSDAGDPALAMEIASQLFPTPWTQPAVADLFAARERIADRIVELTASAPGPSLAQPSTTTPAASGGATTSPNGTAAAGGSGCAAGEAGALAALGLLGALVSRRRRLRLRRNTGRRLRRL